MSLKQIVDEIVKRIRGNKTEKEPEEQMYRHNIVQVDAPGEKVCKKNTLSDTQIRKNNWRKMHGLPLKRKRAMCQILTQK